MTGGVRGYTTHDLNIEPLRLGIGLVAAQHLEGGPQAQLYIHVGDVEFDISGSHGKSFREVDGISVS